MLLVVDLHDGCPLTQHLHPHGSHPLAASDFSFLGVAAGGQAQVPECRCHGPRTDSRGLPTIGKKVPITHGNPRPTCAAARVPQPRRPGGPLWPLGTTTASGTRALGLWLPQPAFQSLRQGAGGWWRFKNFASLKGLRATGLVDLGSGRCGPHVQQRRLKGKAPPARSTNNAMPSFLFIFSPFQKVPVPESRWTCG